METIFSNQARSNWNAFEKLNQNEMKSVQGGGDDIDLLIWIDADGNAHFKIVTK